MKSETMPKKKKSYLSRLGMTLLTILLIVLFIFIMSLVSKIQGTARVSIMPVWSVERPSVLLNWRSPEAPRMK